MEIKRSLFYRTSLGLLFAWQTLIALPSAVAEVRRLSPQVERVRQIVLSRGNNPAALAHLVQLTKDLSADEAAELFADLAEEYLQQGHFDLAAEVLRQLVDQYPEQPPTADGLIQLVRLYSSSEVAHATHTTAKPDQNKTLPAYALHVARQALKRRPDLGENSALAFQCAVATRLSGNSRTAKSWLTPLKHNPRIQPWHECALVESWLEGKRNDSAPKPTIHCPQVSERPYLDGQLDDQIWQEAESFQLSSPGPPGKETLIKLACDDEFLLLAIRCHKLIGATYLADQSPRAYDDDLSSQDRLRLTLDLDRDYATWFQLAVDHRGKTSDACWLNSAWNPRWYVASDSNESSWTVEAAIPWEELTPQPPKSGEAWALAIERNCPSQKPQCWAGAPAEDINPSNFGLILFD